jgi:glycosyltransferase involved in cell wall biosynthesis
MRGRRFAEYTARLHALTAELGLEDRVTWAGARLDMPAVYNAFDLLASTSTSESFPNVIGEAMACGLPCVVTDVGDSARIVGDAGRAVPPGDPAVMAAAWERLLSLDPAQRADLSARARARIEAEFTLEKMITATENLLEEVVQRAD